MERKHRRRIIETFPILGRQTDIVVLDIADDYGFMDDELVELVVSLVAPHIEDRRD